MELILNIFLNLTCIFTGIWVIDRVTEKRASYFLFRRMIVIILSIGQTFISFFNMPLLNTVTMLGIIIASTMIVFEIKKVKFLLYDLLVFMSMFVSDLVATLCLSVVSNSTIHDTLEHQNLIIARYLLTCIFTFILCNVAFSLLKKKHINIRWHEIIIYAVLAIGEAITAAYIERNVQNSSSGLFLILFLLFCFLLDIYIVFVFERISKSRKTEKEIALLKQQSNLQFSVYRDLQKRYEHSIRIVHDVKKHVNALEGLIELENTSKASQYKDSLFHELDKLHPSFKNSNELITVIVNHALLKMDQNNIKSHMQIDDLDLSFISDIDLTTIISNILDNSIEASLELPECKRKIWFVMERKMGCFLIHSENYYENVNNVSNNTFQTTKQGHLGVGLNNIAAIVKKYDGMFSAIANDEKFITSVTIPVR